MHLIVLVMLCEQVNEFIKNFVSFIFRFDSVKKSHTTNDFNYKL